MKRISIIFCLTVYIFVSVFVFPSHLAYANPLAVAVPVGIEVGAGVYVTGAIALAALAGAFGYTQYQSDINAHALRVWEAANDTVKKSLRDALVAAYTVGQKTITIPQDVYDYVKSKLGSLTSQARSITTFTNSSYGTAYRKADGTGAGFSLLSPFVLHMKSVENGYMINSGLKSVNISCNPLCYSTINGGYQDYATKVAPAGDIFAIISWINSRQSSFRLTVEYSGASDSLGDIDAILDKSKGGIFEFSPSTNTPVMTLPDMANFPAKDLVTGQSVTWNPSTQAWERNDGVPVSKDNVKVGSPTLSLDVPTKGDVVISYTDATTGTITKVTHTTTTGEGTGEGVGTGEGSPTKTADSEANRWKQLVTTKFPFSLPFDLYNILSVLNAEPKKPVLKLDATGRISGETVHLKFTQNVDFLDPYMPFLRTFILISYVLFLIFSTRKLLGGGQ